MLMQSATRPSSTRIALPIIDFFSSAVMVIPNSYRFASCSPTPHRLRILLPVQLVLLALEPQASHAEADHGEGKQDFPVNRRWLLLPGVKDTQCQL